MPIFSESEQKIYGDILFDLINNTNLTRSSAGSKTKALANAVSKKLGKMWAQFDANMVQAFLSGAEGKFLDFIGGMMSVPRLGEAPASVSSADQVIKFYTDLGTFGTINNNLSINIPAGHVISTLEAGEGVRYVLPFSVILPSDSSSFYIAAESLSTGTSSNVGSETLIHHDFTDYADVVNDSLKVTNDAEISAARDVESDSNYRFRIANQVVAAEQANPTSIRLATLIVPGIADMIMLPFNRGIGTFDVLIKATTPHVSEGLITAVKNSVDKVTGQGIVNKIRGPREIGVSLNGTLIPRRKLSSSEESSIIRAVTDNVTRYIDNLDIGEEFVIAQALERVLSTSDLIKSIGTRSSPFDSIFIYKPSRLEDNKVRETLIDDYKPEADEKLLVEDEFGGTTPIFFRISV